jgi:TonB family protein
MRGSLGALIGGIEGPVTLELTLDEAGNVVDARAISGPIELRQEAVRWALDWRYDPTVQKARSLVATVSFRLPERDPQLSFPVLALASVLETTDLPPASLVLRSVQTADLDPPNPALQAKLESYIGRSFGPDGVLAEAIQSDLVAAVDATTSYKALHALIVPRADGAVLLVRRPMPMEYTTNPDNSKNGAPKRITVGGAVQSSRALEKVQPNYPALARQAKVQGTVNLTVILTEEGTVRTVEVIAGHPLLIPAAVEAVKQWRYRPTLLNGSPVEVQTTVDINFSLSE